MKNRSSKVREVDRSPEWQDEEDEPSRSRFRLYLVPAAVLVLVLALVFVIQSAQDESVGGTTQVSFGGQVSGPAPKVGAPAPDFTLTSLDGKSTSLNSFKGKVVLLNFFATWCPPCRAEMPDLKATYNELKDKGFEIVAVDLQEDRNTVSGYAKSLGLDFTVLLDRDAAVFGQYHVNGLPTSYFIDRDGTIQELIIGGVNKKIIKEKLDKLLK